MKYYKEFIKENHTAVIYLGILTTIYSAIKKDLDELISSPGWQIKTIKFFIIMAKIAVILYLLSIFSGDKSLVVAEEVVNEAKKEITDADIKKAKTDLKKVHDKIAELKKKHIESIQYEEEQLKTFVGKDKYKKEAVKELSPYLKGKEVKK